MKYVGIGIVLVVVVVILSVTGWGLISLLGAMFGRKSGRRSLRRR
jgi:hypothetical protein